jgi:hypothetical protein
MSRAALVFALLSAIAAPSGAQAPKSIDPGMSEARVVERIGQPDASRVAGDFKYLFYHNGCIKQCGMDDVVILQKDSVVDAVFRAAERAYTGKSSSPRSIPADVAARTRPGARDVASEGVVQAGEPRADSSVKHEAKPDSTTATTPARKPRKHKSAAPSPAAQPDSARHDTVTGTLRIPVKPPIHSAKVADSLRAEDAKRPPHAK